MSFTATLQSVNLQGDNFVMQVLFSDSATGYSTTKTYNIPNDSTVTKAALQARVTADGTDIKNNLTKLNQIQTLVGNSITI